MKTINNENPLIIQHRKSKGEAPLPKDFNSFEEFLVAHRNWLRELRLENKSTLGKLFHIVRNDHRTNGTTYLFAYLSKVIHIRKEYDAFLVRGIDSCTKKLGK